VSNASANLLNLAVTGSLFDDSSQGAGILLITTSTGGVTAGVERSAFTGNGAGVNLLGSLGTGPIKATVTDSAAINNATGFAVQSSTGMAVSSLMLTRVTASGNSHAGVSAGGDNATLMIGQSTVSGNQSGYSAGPGGTLLSYGDNFVAFNVDDVGNVGSASHR
jgi:hypothetical protein